MKAAIGVNKKKSRGKQDMVRAAEGNTSMRQSERPQANMRALGRGVV